jgi:hypothetical protein
MSPVILLGMKLGPVLQLKVTTAFFGPKRGYKTGLFTQGILHNVSTHNLCAHRRKVI